MKAGGAPTTALIRVHDSFLHWLSDASFAWEANVLRMKLVYDCASLNFLEFFRLKKRSRNVFYNVVIAVLHFANIRAMTFTFGFCRDSQTCRFFLVYPGTISELICRFMSYTKEAHLTGCTRGSVEWQYEWLNCGPRERSHRLKLHTLDRQNPTALHGCTPCAGLRKQRTWLMGDVWEQPRLPHALAYQDVGLVLLQRAQSLHPVFLAAARSGACFDSTFFMPFCFYLFPVNLWSSVAASSHNERLWIFDFQLKVVEIRSPTLISTIYNSKCRVLWTMSSRN